MLVLVLIACQGASSSDITECSCEDGAQGPQGEAGIDGEDGQDGEQGPQGDVGPAGADGGFYWADATGTRVTRGDALIYFDDAGVMWDVDWETAAVVPAVTGGVRLYPTDDCTGEAWVSLESTLADGSTPTMQRPFAVTIDGSGDVYAWAPGQVGESVCFSSMLREDGCLTLTTPYCQRAISLDEALSTTLPSATWTAPLHREQP